MNIDIVVPVLNEAASWLRVQGRLVALAGHEGVKVWVVDGGSTDGTAALATQSGLSVIHSEAGRARQMNTGAAAGTGATLLFLHADTQLPPDWQPKLLAGLSARASWGRFDVRIEGQSALLRVVATLMNWRSRLSGIATGDQAMFMTRGAFDAVGGFPDQPLMEDIEISKRLLKLSRPACLRQRVTTSGRRWDTRGVWRTIFLMWRLRFAYWRGRSPAELAQAYR
ncbi:TIGR04283 family arsenosugar biosynthesis glycosyltransferase [Rhodoferax sp.]|uniref:TIGR04283 family arsenosugar biosynthesis glycosyltransferase n=1 Tax=Rhodoferax sp. TaxID=50421 RepID=UPI00276D811E|nr:TIGR04283 family arsenosugar biosynthesis glycosyltransferase [Rhodoferax sp.]